MSGVLEPLWSSLLAGLDAYASGCATYGDYKAEVRAIRSRLGLEAWVAASPFRRVPLLYASLHAEGEVDEDELGVEGARFAAGRLRRLLDLRGEVREWFGPCGLPVVANIDGVVAPVRTCIDWAHLLYETQHDTGCEEAVIKLATPSSRLLVLSELLRVEQPSVVVRVCTDFVRGLSTAALEETIMADGGNICRRRCPRWRRAARRLLGIEPFLARVVFRMSSCQLYLSATDSGLVGAEPWN